MEEYGESKEKNYPRGRGYGNDYMRGGEVFGGYGYKERADYNRPRGAENREQEGDTEESEGDDDSNSSAHRPAADGEDSWDGVSPIERFPQDERAGGWEIPHDVVEESDGDPERPDNFPDRPPRDDAEPAADAQTPPAADDAPEPTIQYTFGDTGGNRSHSRSYYITQAQLQQRVVEERRGG